VKRVDKETKDQIRAVWCSAYEFRADKSVIVERADDYSVISKVDDGIECSFLVDFDTGEPAISLDQLLWVSEIFESGDVQLYLDSTKAGNSMYSGSARLQVVAKRCAKGWH